MITAEDIERFRQMEEDSPKKLLVIDVMQFFEIEIPADINEADFIESEKCRKICADKILDQTIDLSIDRIATTKDKDGIWDT